MFQSPQPKTFAMYVWFLPSDSIFLIFTSQPSLLMLYPLRRLVVFHLMLSIFVQILSVEVDQPRYLAACGIDMPFLFASLISGQSVFILTMRP